MKIFPIAISAVSILASFASASNDSDAAIRALRAEFEAKFDAQNAKIEALTSELDSLKYLKIPENIDLQGGKKEAGRGLRGEQPQHLGVIIVAVLIQFQQLKDAFEDVHKCVDYSAYNNKCTIGAQPGIESVDVLANGLITLNSGGGIVGSAVEDVVFTTSSSGNIRLNSGKDAVVIASQAVAIGAVTTISAITDGDVTVESFTGNVAVTATTGNVGVTANGRFDVNAGGNMELKADQNGSGTAHAYIGTGDGTTGQVGSYFRAVTNNRVQVYASDRLEMEAQGNVDVVANKGDTGKVLCMGNHDFCDTYPNTDPANSGVVVRNNRLILHGDRGGDGIRTQCGANQVFNICQTGSPYGPAGSGRMLNEAPMMAPAL